MSTAIHRIAWLTSARDQAAVDLLRDILQERVRLEVVVCAVGEKKSRCARAVEDLCVAYGVPYVPFRGVASDTRALEGALLQVSDEQFRTDVKRKYQRWMHDKSLSQVLDGYHCEIIVLAGYMKIVTPVLWAERRIVLNLHPAPPGGPTGTWQDVMWALISVRASRAGGMLHVTTEQLDRGPVVSYYTVAIDNDELGPFWSKFNDKLLEKSILQIAQDEGEREPLFRKIRERQFVREAPLLIVTLQHLLSGRLQIVDGGVLVDGIQQDGACFNDEIEAIIHGR